MTPGHSTSRLSMEPEQSGRISDYADSAGRHTPQSGCGCLQEAFAGPLAFQHGGYSSPESSLDGAVELGIDDRPYGEPVWRQKNDDASFGITPLRHPQTSSTVPASLLSSAAHLCSVFLASGSRPILIVPLTAYDYQTALTPWHRRIAIYFSADHVIIRLSTPGTWPSPKIYWDLVACARMSSRPLLRVCHPNRPS